MAIKNEYLQGVYAGLCQRNPGEKEFLQAVEEVLTSLEPIVERRPDIVKHKIIDRIVEPERTIIFRVSWTDDQGNKRSTTEVLVENLYFGDSKKKESTPSYGGNDTYSSPSGSFSDYPELEPSDDEPLPF